MKNFELKGEHIPFILMVYNAANALISYPIGKLSDRIDRRYILGGGIVMILVADILLSLSPAMPGTFLGMSTGLLVMFVGVAFWGVQIGVTQSMFLALIADIVPEKFRGTSIGIFYLISAVALIIAGSVAGKVADFAGEEIVFVYSSAMAVLSLLTLIFIGKKIKKA